MDNIKALITLLLLLMLGTMLQAQNSSLLIYSEDSVKFHLILDSKEYNPIAQTQVKVEDLNATSHKVKILFTEERVQPTKAIIHLKSGTETSYLLKRNKESKTMTNEYDAMVSTYEYSLKLVSEQSNEAKEQQVSYDSFTNAVVVTNNVDVYQGKNTYQTADSTNNNSYNGKIGCTPAIDELAFKRVLQTISSQPFDDDKISTAKGLFVSKCFSSQQIEKIVALFEFEDNKLDFAKYAYTYAYDLDNYGIVGNAFDFKASKAELLRYIKSK